MNDNKEINIQIPKGYEIDRENSTFECIKFKPVERDLTYNDVCKNLFKGNHRYYISSNSSVQPCIGTTYSDNEAPKINQLRKVLAINKLFNIAKYYNGDWIPDWSYKKESWYTIVKISDCYVVYDCDFINVGMPIFKNKEDARSVIDNLNFRDILDTIFKN